MVTLGPNGSRPCWDTCWSDRCVGFCVSVDLNQVDSRFVAFCNHISEATHDLRLEVSVSSNLDDSWPSKALSSRNLQNGAPPCSLQPAQRNTWQPQWRRSDWPSGNQTWLGGKSPIRFLGSPGSPCGSPLSTTRSIGRSRKFDTYAYSYNIYIYIFT